MTSKVAPYAISSLVTSILVVPFFMMEGIRKESEEELSFITERAECLKQDANQLKSPDELLRHAVLDEKLRLIALEKGIVFDGMPLSAISTAYF